MVVLSRMATSDMATKRDRDGKQKTLLDLQQSFLDLCFGMFLHFNMATFQDLEWGDPRDPISTFNPSALDTDQWISAGKASGMTYACLTAKVSDWMTILTTHVRRTKKMNSITMVSPFGPPGHEELV